MGKKATARVGGTKGVSAIAAASLPGLVAAEMKYDFLGDLRKPLFHEIMNKSHLARLFYEHRAAAAVFYTIGLGLGVNATLKSVAWLASLYIFQQKGFAALDGGILPTTAGTNPTQEFKENLPHLVTKEKLIDLATASAFLTTIFGSLLAVTGFLTLMSPSLLLAYSLIIGYYGLAAKGVANACVAGAQALHEKKA